MTTKTEIERMDRVMRLGCVCCAHLGLPVAAQELHHILYGNTRMGDLYTIPLCRGHHQGDWSGEQIELMEPKTRVSISSGRKAFTRVYPTERELWERVQDRLKLPKTWPTPKIVPRRIVGL